MNGKYPVDVSDYTDELHIYLINHGAKEYKGWTSSFRPQGLRRFLPTAFEDCKPTHFGATIRIFFPSEDDAMLFSLAFGHLITHSYVKQIDSLLKQ